MELNPKPRLTVFTSPIFPEKYNPHLLGKPLLPNKILNHSGLRASPFVGPDLEDAFPEKTKQQRVFSIQRSISWPLNRKTLSSPSVISAPYSLSILSMPKKNLLATLSNPERASLWRLQRTLLTNVLVESFFFSSSFNHDRPSTSIVTPSSLNALSTL